MSAYYNEIDPFKAQVLREAIAAGAIAPGDVDERSIADVKPDELMAYAQCHFFAGAGFWSLALRQAGWPDERPVWTGSCPCPSFSAAGKGEGFADPRHLWPEWYRLIRECRPRTVLGEQVAAAIGHGWLDLVCGDLEEEGYAVAAAVLGAHSAGAPHIRQRLYFCAHAERGRREASDAGQWPVPIADAICAAGERAHADGGQPGNGDLQRGGELGLFAADRAGQHGDTRSGGLFGRGQHYSRSAEDERRDKAERGSDWDKPATSGDVGDCAHAMHPERGTQLLHGSDGRDRADAGRPQAHGGAGTCGEVRSSSDTRQRGFPMCGSAPGTPDTAQSGEFDERDDTLSARLEGHFGDVRKWRGPGWLDPLTARSVAEAGATRGFWADCDWWYGRDGKYRPTGPGIQPLASRRPPDVVLVCGEGEEEPRFGATEARVGRLRMYGDGITVPTARAFIEAVMEAI